MWARTRWRTMGSRQRGALTQQPSIGEVAIMVPQADTVLTFATLRHQELQTESDRARPAARAMSSRAHQPSSLTRTRPWFDSIDFARKWLTSMSTWHGLSALQATMRKNGNPTRAGTWSSTSSSGRKVPSRRRMQASH